MDDNNCQEISESTRRVRHNRLSQQWECDDNHAILMILIVIQIRDITDIYIETNQIEMVLVLV